MGVLSLKNSRKQETANGKEAGSSYVKSFKTREVAYTCRHTNN